MGISNRNGAGLSLGTKMLGHTTLTMLMTRYYRYVPNLTRRDGTLLGRQLERRRRR